jgi:hypothetical protein
MMTYRERRAARKKLRYLMEFTFGRAGAIHYRQERPMMEMHNCPPKLNWVMDCSEGVTWLYKCAGLPDPNGLGYNGQGYTGTLAKHGRRIIALVQNRWLRVGDLVLYGRIDSDYDHVAIVYRGGPSRLVARVWSHGSEGGPYLGLPVRYRSDFAEVRRYAPFL